MKAPNPEHEPFHVDPEALEAGLAQVRLSPADSGSLELIVTRPQVDARVLQDEAQLDLALGVVGDTWVERGSSRTPDGSANPEAQVTVMNIRAARLMAGTEDRVPLAGDQLYVDLDLSTENLPTGTLLEIGDAALRVTDAPHTGCAKFSERFGVEALRLTAKPDGKFLRLRGINTAVARPGVVRRGDTVRVVRP
ncbi:MAG: MOSC domain-containing protein [Candidatus Nanopelagicales bacterium]